MNPFSQQMFPLENLIIATEKKAKADYQELGHINSALFLFRSSQRQCESSLSNDG